MKIKKITSTYWKGHSAISKPLCPDLRFSLHCNNRLSGLFPFQQSFYWTQRFKSKFRGLVEYAFTLSKQIFSYHFRIGHWFGDFGQSEFLGLFSSRQEQPITSDNWGNTSRNSESGNIEVGVHFWCCTQSGLPVEHSSGEINTSAVRPIHLLSDLAMRMASNFLPTYTMRWRKLDFIVPF